MRKLFLTGLSAFTLTIALTACQPAQKSASENVSDVTNEASKSVADTQVNAELDQWFEKKFMEGVRRYPQFMAQLGIKLSLIHI